MTVAIETHRAGLGMGPFLYLKKIVSQWLEKFKSQCLFLHTVICILQAKCVRRIGRCVAQLRAFLLKLFLQWEWSHFKTSGSSMPVELAWPTASTGLPVGLAYSSRLAAEAAAALAVAVYSLIFRLFRSKTPLPIDAKKIAIHGSYRCS